MTGQAEIVSSTVVLDPVFPWLSFVVLAPFAAAVLIALLPERFTHYLALVGATLSLGGSAVIAGSYSPSVGGLQLAETVELVPSLGIRWALAVDGWGVVLLLLTGVIIYAGVWASWTLEKRVKEFFVLLLVLVAGVFGVFVAQDLFVFFLLYEIAVLPMYLLIGIWGSSNKVAEAGPFAIVFRLLDVGGKEYAAMKLTLMLIAGSALILAAMLGMYWEAGQSFDLAVLARTEFSSTLQWWAFPALWIGFGTLAGLWPFHTWSPDGHAAAPTAVSMLHAGVLMKLGAFGVIRIGMMLLPEGAAWWAFWVGTVAVINVLYGALGAMAQKDLKYIIAYSSVSHMGIVLVGAATMTVNGWNGAIFQMVAHGVMTGLFFALVGLVYERAHDRYIPGMGGFVRPMPFVAAAFTLAAMSSLGLPGTAGFVAEWLVFLGAFESAHPWWTFPALAGAFITAVYVLLGVRTIFYGEGPPERFHDLEDADGSERIALWMLGGCIVLLGVAPGMVMVFIDPTTVAYLRMAVP
ncbi:MAG: NADH-quinone oxidoreductase subunit M [Deltaproteobacteria bacterium]|nr:MAG: NADH-quinone oxidoreductase subunit M [Deltaproteobacteria bacterium]